MHAYSLRNWEQRSYHVFVLAFWIISLGYLKGTKSPWASRRAKKKKIMNVNNVNTVIIMWMPGGLGGNLWNSTTRKGFWNLYFPLGWGVGKRVVLNLTVFCHSVPCPDTFAVSFGCLSGYRSLLPWHSDSQHHYKGPEAACSLAQEKYPSLFCNCFIWQFWAHVLFSHSQRNEKFLSDVMTLISGASLDSILRL